jgi:uncharacterized membrane protein HdeD (DUF308 family)
MMESQGDNDMADQADETAMGRRNWILVLSGLTLFVLGMIVMVMVGKNHHGITGFLAPFFLVAGLVVCAAGMILPSRQA